MLTKPSQLLAALSWASVFIEAWAILTRRVPSDFLSWFFFVFFLVVAFLSTVVASSK